MMMMMMMMVVVVVKSISSFFGRFVSRSNGVRKPFCARAFSSRGKSTHKKEGIFRRDKRRVKPDPTTKNVNKKKEKLYELALTFVLSAIDVTGFPRLSTRSCPCTIAFTSVLIVFLIVFAF